MFRRNIVRSKWFPVVLFLGVGIFAYGDSVTFNFNSLTDTQTTGAIASYMTTALVASGCTGCSVTVSPGPGNSFVYADTTYTGESNVVGPGGSPDTLGTTDNAANNSATPHGGANDTFISNVNDSSTSGGNQIDLQFNGLTFNGTVSFDFEIFPNGTCPVLNSANCGGSPVGGIYPDQPSLELESGLNGAGIGAVTSFGTNGTQYAVTPSTTGADGSSTKVGTTTELAPQWIGTWSTSTALNGNNDLNFIDWPAAIGIDNLTLNYTTTGGGGQSPVPETSSLLLLGTVSGLLIPLFRRFRKA
jgi:hypothetical protein